MQSETPTSTRPHSVSLKVLRLSRPSQTSSDPWISIPNHPDSKAALAYPSQTRDALSLTPLLALPTSFGAAYVDEVFSCTVCACRQDVGGGDLDDTEDGVVVTDLRVEAAIHAPGSAAVPLANSESGTGAGTGTGADGVVPLEITQADDAGHTNGSADELVKGRPMQGVVEYLVERKGQYTLVLTGSYNESARAGEGDPQGTSRRSFRKIYQFTVQSGIDVKTKITEVSTDTKGEGAKGRFILEAKVENVTDQVVVLEDNAVDVADGLQVVYPAKEDTVERPLLAPRDVMQVAFVIVQKDGSVPIARDKDGRINVGRLKVVWRTENGHSITHRTGQLQTRRVKS